MSSVAGFWFEKAQQQQGMVVLVHGNNGLAPQGPGSTLLNHWDYWWAEAIDRGYSVCSIKSPGPDWTMGPAGSVDPDEGDMLLEVVRGIRKWHFGFANLPTWYVGFSNGTGPVSVVSFQDAASRGFAMLCAAGRMEGAIANQVLRKIYIGYGGRDSVVPPSVIEPKIDLWKDITSIDPTLLKVVKNPRQYHVPHKSHVQECYDHLGII